MFQKIFISIAVLYFILSLFMFGAIAAPKTIVLFSHGIADTEQQVINYTREKTEHFTIDIPHVTFNYPDATTHFWRVNFWKTNFGQENDIATLSNTYNNLIGENPFDTILLYGLSRGGATAINLLGQNRTPRIKAVVLESVYDSIRSVAKQAAKNLRLSYFSRSTDLVHGIMARLFSKYSQDGLQPINSVAFIDPQLPILLVCSKEDTLVPWESTMELYQALRKTGHANTYILVLKHGKHGRIITGTDAKEYHNVAHAFYKKYGLPNDPTAAAAGEQALALCQPSY